MRALSAPWGDDFHHLIKKYSPPQRWKVAVLVRFIFWYEASKHPVWPTLRIWLWNVAIKIFSSPGLVVYTQHCYSLLLDAVLLEEYRIFIFYNNFRSYLVLNILLSQGAEHNMLLKHQTLRDIFCFELSKVNFGWRIQPEATELGPSSTSRVNTI